MRLVFYLMKADITLRLIKGKTNMKTLSATVAIVIASAAAITSLQAAPGIIDTTKGMRFGNQGLPLFAAESASARGTANCPQMQQQKPVVRIYSADSKGRATIARTGTENRCATITEKKAGSRETQSSMTCSPSQQSCNAMRG
ncbi:hypothetical protein DB346_23400 [Verrucomicrobia bacterium LW23]|nr:hypothetical protein DB346_23400 [Verrucomicrobia bacterium LW23]